MKNFPVFSKQDKTLILQSFEQLALKLITRTLSHLKPYCLSWIELSHVIFIYDRLIFPNKKSEPQTRETFKKEIIRLSGLDKI